MEIALIAFEEEFVPKIDTIFISTYFVKIIHIKLNNNKLSYLSNK